MGARGGAGRRRADGLRRVRGRERGRFVFVFEGVGVRRLRVGWRGRGAWSMGGGVMTGVRGAGRTPAPAAIAGGDAEGRAGCRPVRRRGRGGRRRRRSGGGAPRRRGRRPPRATASFPRGRARVCDGEALAAPTWIEQRVQALALARERRRAADRAARPRRRASPARTSAPRSRRRTRRRWETGPRGARSSARRSSGSKQLGPLQPGRRRDSGSRRISLQRRARVLLAERALAREQRVQQHARREDVRAQVDAARRASARAT